MTSFLTSPTGLALTLSTAVFVITIILVVFRAIGFWTTLLLLLFSLLIGTTVGNIDVLRNAFSCHQQNEIEALRREIDQLKEKFKPLSSQTEAASQP